MKAQVEAFKKENEALKAERPLNEAAMIALPADEPKPMAAISDATLPAAPPLLSSKISEGAKIQSLQDENNRLRAALKEKEKTAQQSNELANDLAIELETIKKEHPNLSKSLTKIEKLLSTLQTIIEVLKHPMQSFRAVRTHFSSRPQQTKQSKSTGVTGTHR